MTSAATDSRKQTQRPSALGPCACAVPTAAELLERAHDMLARAHIMLDGWQEAVDWHHDYERFKAPNTELTGDSPVQR